jgi:uncharacterized protein YciI
LSGRKVPRTGGVIIANCNNIEEVMSIVAEDPFYKNNLAKYDVTQVQHTMSSDDFKKYL